jgi:hypothetical protein
VKVVSLLDVVAILVPLVVAFGLEGSRPPTLRTK